MKRFVLSLVLMGCLIAALPAAEAKKDEAKLPDLGTAQTITNTFVVHQIDDGMISAKYESDTTPAFITFFGEGFNVGDELKVAVTVMKKADSKTPVVIHSDDNPNCACRTCKEARASKAKLRDLINTGVPKNGAPVNPDALNKALQAVLEDL